MDSEDPSLHEQDLCMTTSFWRDLPFLSKLHDDSTDEFLDGFRGFSSGGVDRSDLLPIPECLRSTFLKVFKDPVKSLDRKVLKSFTLKESLFRDTKKLPSQLEAVRHKKPLPEALLRCFNAFEPGLER